MQNRYVGDVGDFAKYGLLRLAAQRGGLRIGVLWFLFGNESHNSDGRHISYLSNPAFAALDESLHASLLGLIKRGRRSVRAVALCGLLPRDTVFFNATIQTDKTLRLPREQRLRLRAAWVVRALRRVAECDLVFFDPDNGVETASVQRHAPKAGKYVFWDELSLFWEAGKSLLVYHHLNRTAPVVNQIAVLRTKFAKQFPNAGEIRLFLFRKGSCRVFCLVAQENHMDSARRVLEEIRGTIWRDYLEIT